MPICAQATPHFHRIRLTSVAIERGETEGAGRTELGIVTAAVERVSLWIAVEIDYITRLGSRQKADTQGRREIVQSIQMPVSIGHLMSRISHRFRDIQRNVRAHMG